METIGTDDPYSLYVYGTFLAEYSGRRFNRDYFSLKKYLKKVLATVLATVRKC